MSKELRKQLVDQLLHSLWGAASGLLPWAGGKVASVWELGWIGYTGGAALALGSLAGWIIREVRQWTDPDHPGAHLLWEGAPGWLDPALDSGFWGLAFVLALTISLV